MTRSLLFVFAFCVGQTATAQSLSVEAEIDADLQLFEEARTAVHETQVEKADDLFREVLDKEPAMAIAYGYRAVVDMYLFRDPSENAAAALRLAKRRSAGESLMTEILIRFADGNHETSVTLLWKFLRSYPDDEYAQHVLGQVLIELGRAGEAVETLRELIRNHPDYVPAWNHLGNAFLELDNMVAAKAASGMYLELSTGNPSAHDSYAEVLAREGDVEEAVRHLERAVELEPRMAYAWMHMGDILFDAGSLVEAIVAYEKAVETSLLYGPEFRDMLAQKIADASAE